MEIRKCDKKSWPKSSTGEGITLPSSGSTNGSTRNRKRSTTERRRCYHPTPKVMSASSSNVEKHHNVVEPPAFSAPSATSTSVSGRWRKPGKYWITNLSNLNDRWLLQWSHHTWTMQAKMSWEFIIMWVFNKFDVLSFSFQNLIIFDDLKISLERSISPWNIDKSIDLIM